MDSCLVIIIYRSVSAMSWNSVCLNSHARLYIKFPLRGCSMLKTKSVTLDHTMFHSL